MNPQGTPTGAEQRNGVDKTQETIALNQKAEEIAEKVGTEEAKQQLQELKQVTISKLRDLQLETSHNLHDLQGDIDFSIGTITQEEFADIEEEYADIEDLIAELPRPEIPNELENISNTKFEDLSISEAESVLGFLQENHLSFQEGTAPQRARRLSYVSTLGEANKAQEVLIDIIHGEGTIERGYTDDGMILGYSTVEGGNYLLSQSEYEEKIRSGDIFNPRMFANYAKFLTDNGRLEELPDLMGDRMKAISEFMTTSDDDDIKTVRRRLVDARILEEDGGIGDILRRGVVAGLTEIMIGINEKTVEKGDEGVDELIQRLQSMSQYSKFGYSLENIIGSELYGNIQESFTELGSSRENIHTRLFKLSSTIHDIGEGFYNNPRFSFLEGNPIELAHNRTTEGIITRMVKEEDGYLSVGFDSQDGYYVLDESEFTSKLASVDGDFSRLNKTEVGTFLCSLHSKISSPEEMLVKIEEIFGAENTLRILHEYKDGNFGGQNFSGANWRRFYGELLNGFDNKMIAVASLYFETEQDGDRALSVIEASNNLPELNDVNIDPQHLHNTTRHSNISNLSHTPTKNVLMSERSTEFTDTALTYQENMLTSFEDIYGESPEIMLFLERSLSINGADQNDFDIDAIETLITEHNNSHPERPLPSLQTSELSNILNAVRALREVNLAIKFDQSMSQIIQLQEEMNNIHIKLEASRQALIIAQEEGNQEAINAARNESMMQQRASYGAAMATANAIQKVNEANPELSETLTTAIANGDLSTLEDIRENNELNESDKEILSQLMLDAQSYLDKTHGTLQETLKELIPEEATPEQESAFIDALTLYFHKYTIQEVMENPQIRLSKITNKDILLQLLTDNNANLALISTNFRHLPLSLRNDKDIALAFPGKIEEEDFPFMQPSLLSDSHFIKSVIAKSINRRSEEVGVNKENLGLLLQRYCASGGDTRAMVIILGDMFQIYPELRSEIRDNIPYAILNSDSEGVLGIDISSLPMGADIMIGILNGLGDIQGPNDFENRFIPTFRNADKILERNPGNTELKLLIIEKGGLASTTYLRGNLGFDRSSITWEHVLKHDINSIRFLEEGTRKSSYFQQKFVENLDESAVRESGQGEIVLGYLLQYIPLDTPIEIFNFMDLLKTKFPQTFGGGENGDFPENVYRFIGANEKFRNTITTYFNTYGIDGLDDEPNKDKIIIFLYNSISHSSQLYKDIQTMQTGFESFAKIESHFDELLKQELRDTLGMEEGVLLNRATEILINSKGGILEEDTAELLRIIGSENMGDLLVIYDDISTRRSNSQDALIGEEEQDPSDFNNNFLPFLMENNEGNMVLNIDKIKENLYILILSNYTGDRHGFNDFTSEFLESEFGLEGDELSKVSQLILNRFNEEQRVEQIKDAIGEDGKVTEDFLEAMRAGTVGERADLAFRQQQEKIFQTYKGIRLDEDGNITLPSESQQNVVPAELGLDTRDTYREISTELMLTPEEQNSLTPEELEAIASDESVRESFIGFRSTLVELGLTELWKFRNDIFKAIGSLNFNASDGDYIGENEFNIFLAETVYATTQDSRLKPTPSNIENTKELVRQINKQSGGVSDVDNVNSVGEAMTLVENGFREKFAPRNSGIISFKISEFQTARRS